MPLDILYSYYLRGKVFEEQKEYQKAIADYDAGLTQSDKDSLILSKLIPLLIRNNHAEQAIPKIRI